MKDMLVKGISYDSTIIAVAASTTQMVKEAQRLHDLSPVATAALGRTMTAASMMATFLKNEGNSLTVQIKGDGPLGGIVVVSDWKSNVRGYVYNPLVDIPLNQKGKLDVATAVGRNGYLNVIKDLGLKEPYIGYVDLVSGEIAEDITYYYANSEQTPSSVALGVLANKEQIVLSAGGFLLQLMPGVSEDAIDYVEEKISKMPPISNLLVEGASPLDILDMLLLDYSYKVLEERETKYQCYCNNERMERNLLSLGKKDLNEVFSGADSTELVCQFCNQKYVFSKEAFLKYL